MNSIRLKFVGGFVRVYVDEVLRLETRYQYNRAAPMPTPETDAQLKRWADYLSKFYSDDPAARLFGKSGLEADGFRQGQDGVWRRD